MVNRKEFKLIINKDQSRYFALVKKMGDDKHFDRSTTQIIMDSVALILGPVDIIDLENQIYDRYDGGDFALPKDCKNFQDVLRHEIIRKPIGVLLKEWKVTPGQLGMMLYRLACKTKRVEDAG